MSQPEDLTPSQWAAVDHFEGPLLVLAGPGSGKTRVITRRIARLIDRGVHPRELLAITFTNKAAREMAARVQALVPEASVWVSTFHRFCARLLRRYAGAVGLQPNFTILDTSDQKQVLRGVLADLNFDATRHPPGRILHAISQAKNRCQPADLLQRDLEEKVSSYFERVVSQAYLGYQQALLASNSVDFDDLLLHTCQLLADNEEIRSDLDRRFRFVLVDEYQDTNMAQYRIVTSLSRDFSNLCVTGDPDQSIYGWRGAEIGNILRFEADYPHAKVVRLEENYRSTKEILQAADTLIAHNVYRKPKALFTQNAQGAAVELLSFLDERHEAQGLADLMHGMVEREGRAWSDFAVFYRVNALSRGIETALVRAGIPYQIAAGVAFYDRAEVKDMLAYLRLVHNPADRTAFLRVVNTPLRGIGKATIEKLSGWADASRLNLLDAARQADRVPELSKKASGALIEFASLIDELSHVEGDGVSPIIAAVIELSHYTARWEAEGSEEDQQRLANVQELVSAAHEFDQQFGTEASLEGFLESASLVADTDALSERGGQVTLMTLHAAKGLEFPVVFITAVEQNILPHERSLQQDDPREIEEERRLLFVGVTRARERLFVTSTFAREFRGNRFDTIPSPFLAEMELVPGIPPAPRFGVDPHISEDMERWLRSSAGEPRSDGEACTSGPQPPLSDPDLEFPPRKSPATPPPWATHAKLLTGSQLAAQNREAVGFQFEVGMSVRHPTLGLGTVVEARGSGKRRTISVEFRTGRTSSFVVEKSPLQPVGQG